MSDHEGECYPPLDQLTDDQKNQLIEAMHQAIHDKHETASQAILALSRIAAVAETMAVVAEATNVKGHRRQGLEVLRSKLVQLSASTYALLGITQEARDEAAQFMDIISPLEEEGLGKGIE